MSKNSPSLGGNKDNSPGLKKYWEQKKERDRFIDYFSRIIDETPYHTLYRRSTAAIWNQDIYDVLPYE